MAKRGRPTEYDAKAHPLIAAAFARSGKTQREIAKLIGIAYSTLHEWMDAHPEFSDAVKTNAVLADAQVESALFKRATGYEYDEIEQSTEVLNIERTTPAGKVKDRITGKTVVKKTRKAVAPDVSAIRYWLNNRQPDRYRSVPKEEPPAGNKDLVKEWDASLDPVVSEVWQPEEDVDAAREETD